ncbi:hypothetical protein IV38_GL001872 [Lactobacillus selangorensis]|uniref:Peptidase M10 metallopeptidase domain-containing protein n=1 Tax=Lactobacillus selangorensis TaxID=81857 RepID=A0A0R2FRH9_9LACO|nr:matrixin family metalloprotease [Lactobacillus selangorensis]KRN27660.1 hypothetical protein IV38_GL001872 [Lactobacillus selangorensis]KRN30373.1 hypothetical protein IV40_GL001962 [Lactobacillus selangorensis]
MRHFMHFLRTLFIWGLIAAGLYITAPRWQASLQSLQLDQQFTQKVTKASEQTTPSGWKPLEKWWLIGANGTLTYNATALPQYTTEIQAAAHWWNQLAGHTIIQTQTNQKSADVYLAPVSGKYFNFSGLTGNNHLLLFNASVLDGGDANDIENVFIHEFGHALGLDHAPQRDNEVMSPTQAIAHTLQAPTSYDRTALTATLKRLKLVQAKKLTADNYTRIASQTLLPSATNNLSDATYNGREALASVIGGVITSAKKQDDSALDKLITANKANETKLEGNNVTDQQIKQAEKTLDQLIRAAKMESDFPHAYSTTATDVYQTTQ